MKVIMLGSGTSVGVPVIGCTCHICTSTNPKNKRFRSSVYIEVSHHSFIIDTTPDFRLQCLHNNISNVDAVLYTHTHTDHINGIDELRVINILHKKSIPMYATKETLMEIRKRFEYIFAANPKSWVPQLIENELKHENEIFGEKIFALDIEHADDIITAFRIRDFAYITDASGIPERSIPFLRNLDVLIINAVMEKPLRKHFSLQQALDQIEVLKPRRAYLTHMSHQFDFDELSKRLPHNVFVGYDGLSIQIN